MKPLLVLRPEPGNSATAARARAMGLEAVQCPLFEIEPVEWTTPDAASFDYVLLTSANALRHGGMGLAALTTLDALAVGAATADAALGAGFRVAMAGDSGVEALLDTLPGERRLLHLAGAEYYSPATRHSIERIVVYRSLPVVALISSGQHVALVHSPRAGARLADLAPDRAAIAIAAISPAAASACGTGWVTLEASHRPDDVPLLALAARLCQD